MFWNFVKISALKLEKTLLEASIRACSRIRVILHVSECLIFQSPDRMLASLGITIMRDSRVL